MANLTQLRMLENLDGFLPVDKPAGIAFSTVVKTVKRKFNLVKVGHGGSLDAQATGLLMILVGDANKFAAEVMGADRAYEGVIRLGLRTNTFDVHGTALAPPADLAGITDEAIARAADTLRGDVFQTEPQFSAIRREGSATYEIADTGAHEAFLAHVYRFTTGAADNARVPFSLVATKAVLPRVLANDLGDALGCGAALETLRRTRIGKFSVDGAIPFNVLLETEPKDFASCVTPIAAALR